MRNDKPKNEILRRLAAVLAAQGITRAALSGRCGISDPHLRAVLLGERRLSAQLAERLETQLGVEAWAFVCGETNTLQMPVAGDEGGRS